jgi:hypothetical protein
MQSEGQGDGNRATNLPGETVKTKNFLKIDIV